MYKKKRKELEEKGFRVGSAADFLELTPEEEAYIDIRLDKQSGKGPTWKKGMEPRTACSCYWIKSVSHCQTGRWEPRNFTGYYD